MRFIEREFYPRVGRMLCSLPISHVLMIHKRQVLLLNDNFEYMKTWYFSLEKTRLKAVIFHDGLSHKFQDKFKPDVLKFKLTSLRNRTTNDARFYAYLRYLHEHPNIDRVLLTDISDVEFIQNPFHLMDILGDHLYIGRDIDIFPNMQSMGWLTKRLGQCFSDNADRMKELSILKKLEFVYNAGVIGGTRTLVLQFLTHVTDVPG